MPNPFKDVYAQWEIIQELADTCSQSDIESLLKAPQKPTEYPDNKEAYRKLLELTKSSLDEQQRTVNLAGLYLAFFPTDLRATIKEALISGKEQLNLASRGLRFDSHMACALAKVLKFSVVTSLNVSHLNIGDDGIIALASLPLKELILQENKSVHPTYVDRIGKSAIDALQRSQSLQILDLSYNRLQDDAILALAQMNLIKLDLAGNYPDNDSLAALAKHPTLTHLGLGGTKCFDYTDFCREVAKNKVLQYLFIGGTRFNDQCARLLSANRSLQVIDAASTRISGEAIKDLGTIPTLQFIAVCDTNVNICRVQARPGLHLFDDYRSAVNFARFIQEKSMEKPPAAAYFDKKQILAAKIEEAFNLVPRP